MGNPIYLRLYDRQEQTTRDIDMKEVDRLTVAPARELMSPTNRTIYKIDALDWVIRIQFKGTSSKEFPLSRYSIEFIYP